MTSLKFGQNSFDHFSAQAYTNGEVYIYISMRNEEKQTQVTAAT